MNRKAKSDAIGSNSKGSTQRIQRRCPTCLRDLEPDATPSRGYCRRPRCMRVRWIVYRLRRGLELELRCRWCTAPALPGLTWCAAHQVLKRPCACGATIPRRAGRGRQPERCAACNPDRHGS